MATAVRGLHRWNRWPLNWTTIIPDWDSACIWQIPAEDNIWLVSDCHQTGDCNMFISFSPDERKMAGFDWTPFLDGKDISVWGFEPLPADITRITADWNEEENITTIMWTGGTVGKQHQIRGWIVTSDGRKEYEQFTVLVKPS